MRSVPLSSEDHISKVPALQLLQELGWQYLSPQEALAERGGRTAGVLLEGILERQLRAMNRVRYRGEDYPFSEGNIHAAVQALRTVMYDGLVRTNEKIYDLLCLGKSLQQSIQGDIKSFTLQYIDWEHPERNVYHVTEEFEVERSGRKDSYVPDIVLFVNGIPLVVIECKRPDLPPGKDPLEQAISQHLRNQKENGIPELFTYAQLLMGVCVNDARYGTVGTPRNFWAQWRAQGDHEAEVVELVRAAGEDVVENRVFESREPYVTDHFDQLQADGGREVTEQDRAIWALCRPERLLELTQGFILFDAGEKKIARYQQYFCVKKIMDRIRTVHDGSRKGGVVWHTQGSGKSLTMVMLGKAIARDDSIRNHRIVLVTDRVDLDDQIHRTFQHCGVELKRATTGANLAELLESDRQQVITTVINKFYAAVGKHGVRIEDPNVFVLVDEGHRTQYGPLHARMRRALPNACFIAFTGTPVMKKDRDTVARFGGLIEPTYTIDQAEKDGAVVPLIYEGRHVKEKVDAAAIDEWFERVTEDLTAEQNADLKKKFSTERMIMRAEPVVREIAWDISTHFRDNWQGTPFKGQLVTPRKETAILYKKYLDEFGMVRSEVLISGPDDREGEEDIYGENKDPVIRFWKAMMDKYGTEKDYNRQIINAFKHGDPTDPGADVPEILIVVDKLLTGFDAPCNTVLYLARELREHTLLQAIARVNRLHDGKDLGYVIDYRGVLESLDHALDIYSNLSEFNPEDLEGMVRDVRAVLEELPQKHSALWDLFKDLENKRDQEEYERLLADDALRVRFYERFTDFGRALGVALSSAAFYEETPEERIEAYKGDLKFFNNLRTSVRRRYAEVVDFSEYEPKIRKLLDTYLGTEEVEEITGKINLLNRKQRQQALDEATTDAAKADVIAHNTKRTIDEKWREDPAFYRKFSKMLEDVIEAFRQGRLREREYLSKAEEIEQSVTTRSGDNVPSRLASRDVAKAYFGCIRDVFEKHGGDGQQLEDCAVEASLRIDEIIEDKRIVHWTSNPDVQNRMRQAIEEYLFELQDARGLDLSFAEIDTIMEECLDIARIRRP